MSVFQKILLETPSATLVESNDHYHGADHITWIVRTPCPKRPGSFYAFAHRSLAAATKRVQKLNRRAT